ncbi:hypothetical protein ACFONC_08455 [Luteimonas soli]|uniref:DUF2306 domain-containing protein n=1 Tax=Luteimonas soli TaxID=1648966 RepID=A0ABV7XKY3_9GAMM
MDAYRWFLFIHVAAGTVALATYWTAAAMRKGTPRHRLAGRAFLLAMLPVLASGVPLSLAIAERGRPLTAIFLGYILLLTGSACWSAWRAIRDRNHRERYFGPMYWIFAALVGVSGLGVAVMGTMIGALLFQVFGAVGVAAGVDSVVQWRRAPDNPRWWLREHFNAMIGNGIAVHIAFVSIGLRSVLAELDLVVVQYLAWFGPLVVAVVAAVWLNRKYGGARARASLPRGVLDDTAQPPRAPAVATGSRPSSLA